MDKVTRYINVIFCLVVLSCQPRKAGEADLSAAAQSYTDSATEARIDSVYAELKPYCDSILKNQVPLVARALVKGDSTLYKTMFDSITLYSDTNKKAEKVIRRLQEDCRASWLAETYRITRSLKPTKPVRSLR